jgi:hypothetical protein
MIQKFDDEVLNDIVNDLKKRIKSKTIISLFVVKKLVIDNNYFIFDRKDTKNYFFYLSTNKNLPVEIGKTCLVVMKSSVPIYIKPKPVRVSMFNSSDPRIIFMKSCPFYHFTTIYASDFVTVDKDGWIVIYCYSWSRNKEVLEMERDSADDIKKMIVHINSLRGNEK